MMAHIFYAIGILAVIYEIYVFLQPKRIADIIYALNRETKKEKEERQFTIRQSMFSLFYLGYVVWSFLGLLLTSSWPVFLFLLVVPMFIRKIFKIKPTSNWLMVDGLISGFLWAFVVFNHFVLKINLSEVTLNWISSLFV